MNRNRAFVSVILLSILPGCGTSLPGISFRERLPFVPKGAEAVRFEAFKFEQPDSHVLLTLSPGAVKDPFDQISGCWGAVYTLPILPGVEVRNADYYQFDLVKKKVVFQRLQRGFMGDEYSALIEYDLVSIESDRLTLQHTRVKTATNVRTAGLDGDGVIESDSFGETEELLMVLQGDDMVVFDGDEWKSLFRRFECPK